MKRLPAVTAVVTISAVVAALVLSGGGSAASSRRITLQIGDVFLVAGTHLGCQTQVGKRVIPGKKLVTCFKVKGNELAPTSYIVALGANGRVVVARVNAHGSPGTVVFDRKPAVAGSSAKQYTVRAGDILRLAGTDIGCAVNRDAIGIYPTCFRHTSSGGLPRSLAFAQTEKFVAILKFSSTGTTTKVVFKRAHGR